MKTRLTPASVLVMCAFSNAAIAEQAPDAAPGSNANNAVSSTTIHGDIHPGWERGKLMNILMEQKKLNQPSSQPATGHSHTRVTIYFDKTGTLPGLPRDLGNTQQGRSIMLKYLQQASSNTAS